MAVCDNELDAGVLSYGHPIRVSSGYVVYSVGITGLADRFRPMEANPDQAEVIRGGGRPRQEARIYELMGVRDG